MGVSTESEEIGDIIRGYMGITCANGDKWGWLRGINGDKP